MPISMMTDKFIRVLFNNVAGSWTPSSTTLPSSTTWPGRTRGASWSPSAVGRCSQPRDTASRCPRAPAGNGLSTWRCCSSLGTVGTRQRPPPHPHTLVSACIVAPLALVQSSISRKESSPGRVNILPNSVASSEYHYLHHTHTHVILTHTHLP